MRLLLMASVCAFIGVSGIVVPHKAQAALPTEQEQPVSTADEEPGEVEDLVSYEPPENISAEIAMPIDIRKEALKEAAISFGARGGLAKRTFEIRQEIDKRSRYLDKVFNFNQLLIHAPSGFLIEPPIVTESMNAMLIDLDGQTAAVSDKIYNIIRNAQIVSAPRTWRVYLERQWGEVLPPPDILTPQDDEERYTWEKHVREGWKLGLLQADEIFQDDLAKMEADFHGMIRYRMLLAQGMISPPYAMQVDRGITGGGNEMKIGDRAVQITGVPMLVNGAESWKPASR